MRRIVEELVHGLAGDSKRIRRRAMELVRRVADNEAIKMRMVPFLAPPPLDAGCTVGPCCNERKMEV